MIMFKQYVPASHIWPSADDHVDCGHRDGYVRGYNVEVITKDGGTDWLSCVYIKEEPVEYFNNKFYEWYYTEHQWKPTGRICFRGYGMEVYDPQEHETYIISVR